MKVLGVIPARYLSSRFPGKPLASILGKSMIYRVYTQAKKCPMLSKVIVATDNNKIANHVESFGGEVMLTSLKHISGTDRCNEVINNLEERYDVVVNIQGDEPYINPEQISQVINIFSDTQVQIGTLAKSINSIDVILNPNIPKIIFNKNMIAVDFQRVLTDVKTKIQIKKRCFYKHIGIYGYKYDVLSDICKLSPTKNEKDQKLEQFRWLDNGYKIKVSITDIESVSVDTPKDILKIEQLMRDFI